MPAVGTAGGKLCGGAGNALFSNVIQGFPVNGVNLRVESFPHASAIRGAWSGAWKHQDFQ